MKLWFGDLLSERHELWRWMGSGKWSSSHCVPPFDGEMRIKTIVEDFWQQEERLVFLRSDLLSPTRQRSLGRRRRTRPFPCFPWTIEILHLGGKWLSGVNGSRCGLGSWLVDLQRSRWPQWYWKPKAAVKLLIENNWTLLDGNCLGCLQIISCP